MPKTYGKHPRIKTSNNLEAVPPSGDNVGVAVAATDVPENVGVTVAGTTMDVAIWDSRMESPL